SLVTVATGLTASKSLTRIREPVTMTSWMAGSCATTGTAGATMAAAALDSSTRRTARRTGLLFDIVSPATAMNGEAPATEPADIGQLLVPDSAGRHCVVSRASVVLQNTGSGPSFEACVAEKPRAGSSWPSVQETRVLNLYVG